MDVLTFNPFSLPLFFVCATGEFFGASSCKCMIIVTSMERERGRERERERERLQHHSETGRTHSIYFSSYQLQLVAYNSLCSSSVHYLPKQTNSKVFYKVLTTIMSNHY